MIRILSSILFLEIFFKGSKSLVNSPSSDTPVLSAHRSLPKHIPKPRNNLYAQSWAAQAFRPAFSPV